MNVSAINNTAPQYVNPSFGHAIRVSISVKRPDAPIYEFVNPAQNLELYKKLNSKIVGWLNSDLISNLRNVLGKKRKIKKQQSPHEAMLQRKMINDLMNIDSDYANLKMARSVYSKYHLGFIATGCDVPIIENIGGVAEIGRAKKGSAGQRTPVINEICKKFHNSTMKYIQHPINRLQENGKEIMLYLNFANRGVDKKGQNIYELENYEFRRILKQLPFDENDSCNNLYYLKYNNVFREEISLSIQRIKDRILGKGKKV